MTKSINHKTTPLEDRLSRIADVKHQIKELQVIGRELSRPQCSDINLIKPLYIEFCSLFKELHPCNNIRKYNHRSKFIFVIIRMFSPSTFLGEKMRIGLRDEIANVVKCQRTAISHDIQLLMFQYRTYRGYRDDVEYLYDKLQDKFATEIPRILI